MSFYAVITNVFVNQIRHSLANTQQTMQPLRTLDLLAKDNAADKILSAGQ